MRTLQISEHILAQSTLVVAPAHIWPGLWDTLVSTVHVADRWQAEKWDNPLVVADVRALHHVMSRTPVQDIKVAAIPHADRMSKEVANALLKLLEEPPVFAYTILFAESAEVLPTVMSRVRLIAIEDGTKSDTRRQQLAQVLGRYALSDRRQRDQAKQLLYATPLIHSTIQLPIIEEGFRPS